MKHLVLIMALTGSLGANAARSIIISEETAEREIATLQEANFKCTPGLPPNGNNFPTTSSYQVGLPYLMFKATNVYAVGNIDMDTNRLGDHCAEIQNEVASILPTKLTITRTVTEEYSFSSGACVKGLSEHLIGQMGTYTLYGSAYFRLHEVDRELCRRK